MQVPGFLLSTLVDMLWFKVSDVFSDMTLTYKSKTICKCLLYDKFCKLTHFCCKCLFLLLLWCIIYLRLGKWSGISLKHISIPEFQHQLVRKASVSETCEKIFRQNTWRHLLKCLPSRGFLMTSTSWISRHLAIQGNTCKSGAVPTLKKRPEESGRILTTLSGWRNKYGKVSFLGY